MINPYVRHLAVLLLWYVSLAGFLHAENIDILKGDTLSVLEHSSLYLDKKELNLIDLIKKDLFQPYHETYINIGVSQQSIWIKLTLSNTSQTTVNKVLVLTSSLLEHIALYHENTLNKPIIKGVSNITEEHNTLFPYYNIHLDANTTQTYYLKVRSYYEPVDFGLKIEDKNTYFKKDLKNQFTNILLIGMVLALMIYSFLVSFYVKDKSYTYYSFYLFFLIYQQFTYLGLTQIYFSPYFVHIDIVIPTLKINLLLITSALFAMHFLKIERIPVLHKGYLYFIYLALLEILVLSIPGMHNLNIVIFTGALFIVFNLFSGVVTYMQGYKQARLFIVGFGIVFASYFLMIFDALGFTSLIQNYQNILMFSTAFESIILTLAFADRYIILQKEKERVEELILLESTNRATIIEATVVEKTRALNGALQTKELLIKEIHHRVKNNLQIILSLLRMQSDDIHDTEIKEKLINLERRVNAISKTYSMLLSTDDLAQIDMEHYIETLLLDIAESFDFKQYHIQTQTNIEAKVPLKQAVYLGLIINELVTNTYKHAFLDQKGTITVLLRKESDNKNYILIVKDNGKGFSLHANHRSLGSKLIKTLVYNQLEGSMVIDSHNHTQYTIRFAL